MELADLIPEVSTPSLWKARLTDDQRWLLKILASLKYREWFYPMSLSQRPALTVLVTEGLAVAERRDGRKVYQLTFLGRRVFAMVGWQHPNEAAK